MKQKIIKYSIITFAYLAILYPLWVRYHNMSWSLDFITITYNLFPGFGLTAFAILWLHSISGVFEPWLRKYFNFDNYVRNTSIIVFICILLHPILLFVMINFDFNQLLSSGQAQYIRLGVIGWMLLITYDIGKFLKRKHDFFVRNWKNILLISTIGFIFTFFHSIYLGSDLQSGPLRVVWIFYGTTAILATIYTYGIKRFFLNS
ncbi:MAG: hypothetical protein Q7S43_04330 [bacterium]|nr:hypothetical protein [bacterium]